jgi:hypothetical protein
MAYDIVRRDVVYNILIEFGINMKLVRLLYLSILLHFYNTIHMKSLIFLQKNKDKKVLHNRRRKKILCKGFFVKDFVKGFYVENFT